jgi:hypothetical protein
MVNRGRKGKDYLLIKNSISHFSHPKGCCESVKLLEHHKSLKKLNCEICETVINK